MLFDEMAVRRRLKTLRRWSVHGWWGSSKFTSWANCIAALLPPENSARCDAPPGCVQKDRMEIEACQT